MEKKKTPAQKALQTKAQRDQARDRTLKNKISTINKRLNNMVIGAYKHIPGPVSYLESLLYPECAHNSKIPGMCDLTVSIRRKVTYNITANALGAVGILWQPHYLSDTTSAVCNFYINNNSTYDGTTTIGSTNLSSVYASQAITPGAVQGWRLVSACISVIPQASVLNQAGSIHGAIIKSLCVPPVGAGGGYSGGSSTVTLLPNFQNHPSYREASISAMEAMRMIYVPNDICYLDFCEMNKNQGSKDSASETNICVFDIVGAGANAPFRVDLTWNYELEPAANSILLGMETLCADNTTPSSVWRDVALLFSNRIVTTGPHAQLTVAQNASQQLTEAQKQQLTDAQKKASRQPGGFRIPRGIPWES